MEFIEPILSIAAEIYSKVEQVKANKKRCRRVSQRIKGLEELVNAIKQREVAKLQNYDQVEKALKELCVTLEQSKKLIEKYTLTTWAVRFLKCNSHAEEFDTLNDRFNDAFQILSGALQVEQGNLLYKVFEQTTRYKEDQQDAMEDDQELKTLLLEYMETTRKDFEALQTNVQKMLDLLAKPKVTYESTRIIKPTELKYGQEPFMTTANSEVYKGEFNGFQVAVKRYIDPKSSDPEEVKRFFTKEVITMRQFESPNILRMFGICIKNENSPNPEFLLITEYCENGSLRQILDSDCKLSWTMKAQMCLDAAQGLYRLHQTEEKSKVHGCLNSSKFLVADGYRVKLGGFELAKTETSLRRPSKDKEMRSLCYCSPQLLKNINHTYTKECEIYSFGVVLWEVATRKRPFEGLSNDDICQKVCEEKYQEPLPDDCPKALGELINACRVYDSFKRPSAGVLMDRLRNVVELLEE
ncbi:unnamed protein product [Ophioblennius macclurei]